MSGQSDATEIKRLSEDVASRIATATVIASLEGAVRQLVDNALDAGATNIEIRANENGFNFIEVVDNGSGIDPENFDKICKPHHTSKLTDLSGFENLNTLGFRGQALNALCALGSVTILTRSASSLLGTKMIFDNKGFQISRSNVARQVGTSITVESLFKTLPVRRKEFEKSSKREFNKVLSCIQCFCLSRSDVKFICSNTTNGKHAQLICTNGNGNVKEVINNLFGGRLEKNKFLDVLSTLPDEEICSIYGLNSNNRDDYDDLQITAYISSCEQGFGRSSPDRQFVYMNKRPIEYAKVTGTVNEIYKQYNKKQYPTFILFIEVPPNSIDVNVTPDKRTVFFGKEKQLLALIRASLRTTFENVLATVDSSIENKTQRTEGFSKSGVPSVFDLLKDIASSNKRPGSLVGVCQKRSKVSAEHTRPLRDFLLDTSTGSEIGVPIEERNNEEPAFVCSKETPIKLVETELTETPKETLGTPEVLPLKQPRVQLIEHELLSKTSYQNISTVNVTEIKASEQPDYTIKEKISPVKAFSSQILSEFSRGLDSHHPRIDDVALDAVEKRINIEEGRERTPIEEVAQASSPSQMTQSSFWRPQQKIKFSKATFIERIQQIKNKRSLKAELPSQLCEYNASANNSGEAEAELSGRLSKTDFEKMTIVGQFNKAFIIARLDDQLFIVDQHAADEKFNFERFQKKAKIDTQVLIRPQLLDFGRVQEMIIYDNLKVFEANGFKFEFREDDSGCSRAYLIGIPVIYSRQFDKRDVDEIISVLRDFPGQMYRPAKTRAIFASRACRKSIMVGTALTRAHMQRIVRNLGTLMQPWNCPHGRPTLRHLLNLHLFQNKFQVHR